MKKTFEMPVIEIVKFETEDVMNTARFSSWREENDLGWEEA